LNISNEFVIDLGHGKIKGDQIACDNSPTDVLFLHGAGKADRTRFDALRTQLREKFKISSTAFDYLGHGDSTESTVPDSLKLRTEQAHEVIQRIHQTDRLSIVASSMSAYIALKLTEKYQVKNLILIVPAVYHHAAYAIPFSPAFTKIIRRDSSWVNSDAWSILEKYTGNLLIIAAENDEVIPCEVIKYLYDFAINARCRKKSVVPDAPHRILEFISEHPEYLDKIVKAMSIAILQVNDMTCNDLE
jgi:pimeloyl-ACP methyl ester carboxylesterase